MAWGLGFGIAGGSLVYFTSICIWVYRGTDWRPPGGDDLRILRNSPRRVQVVVGGRLQATLSMIADSPWRVTLSMVAPSRFIFACLVVLVFSSAISSRQACCRPSPLYVVYRCHSVFPGPCTIILLLGLWTGRLNVGD